MAIQHKERPRMLLAFWTMWVGQSVTMELLGKHRRGFHATGMEGVCHGEAYHRVKVLLTFRMDVYARTTRTTTFKGIDGSTDATATKRFDNVPAPSEIASWMQDEFTGAWYAAYESGCTSFHLCRKRKNDPLEGSVPLM